MKDPFGTLAFIVYLIIIAAMAPLGSRGQLVLLFVKAKLFLRAFPTKNTQYIHDAVDYHSGCFYIGSYSLACISVNIHCRRWTDD